MGLENDEMNRRGFLSVAAMAASSFPAMRASLAENIDPITALTDCVDHHRRFRACFASKFRTGYCDFKGFDGKRTSPEKLLQMLDIARARLTMLSQDKATAAVLYHVRDDGTMDVFVLDQTGPVAWQRVEGQIETVLEGVRTGLGVETRAGARAAKPIVRKTQAVVAKPPVSLEALSALLLPGSVGRVIVSAGYQRLLVLGSGAVGQLPFPALALPDGKALVDQASVLLLADPEALFLNEESYGGSLDLASESLTFSFRDAFAGPKLMVGNPAFGKVEGWTLPPLPGAEAEIQNVAAEFIAKDVLIGKAATQKSIMKTLGQMQEKGGIAYFATHGVSDAANPMDGSFLAVAGGVIRGQEIRKLRMVYKHPLVVMSACQSGLGKTFSGGGYGLARAWYAAGAGQVVGSLWNVSDEGTSHLMTGFARAAVAGRMTVEEALRWAMRSTRDNFSDDPAIWASFAIFGNPSA